MEDIRQLTLEQGKKRMATDFTKDKETKNTFRFTATGEISGSVYIQKDSDLAKESVISVEIAKKAKVSA